MPNLPVISLGISIHALREEGDRRMKPGGALILVISNHALREEGDRLLHL